MVDFMTTTNEQLKTVRAMSLDDFIADAKKMALIYRVQIIFGLIDRLIEQKDTDGLTLKWTGKMHKSNTKIKIEMSGE